MQKIPSLWVHSPFMSYPFSSSSRSINLHGSSEYKKAIHGKDVGKENCCSGHGNVKIFSAQPPLRIDSFQTIGALLEKNAFSARVDKYLTIKQLVKHSHQEAFLRVQIADITTVWETPFKLKDKFL